MYKLIRAALALIVPLALAGCLFVPGKFTSDLTIRADRSFAFAYKGEVLALDVEGMMGGMAKGFGDMSKTEQPEGESPTAEPSEDADTPKEKTPEEIAKEKAERDAKYRELATQLAKEAGYRAVEYRGEGVFFIDYAISGKLTHNFVYPFNQDAAMIFPWVAIELRGKDNVRIKAPGFAKQESSSSGGMGDLAESKLDGTFTLTTDAEIVSQNNEDGAATAPGGKKISWRVSPLTQDAPMAVLKLAPL
jgi:hypothetical protein